ncbi:MAG TPA: prepilin-type N-terminal cleavage/methylation domain-containing protein [bacterium]|nr:prepilin-type N-terminal cleavage/methylation domain-containing protein [bacterium]
MLNLKFKTRNSKWRESGFTFIEMLLVLAILSLLAGLVGTVAFTKIHSSKESALKEDLHDLRKAIDDFYADSGKYPQKLQDLVDAHYLRFVPPDPFTDSVDTWQVVTSQESVQKDRIVDVHSGSQEKTNDGGNYSDW